MSVTAPTSGYRPQVPQPAKPKLGFSEAAAALGKAEKVEAADLTPAKLLGVLGYLQTLPADAQGRKVQIMPAEETAEGQEIYVAYMSDSAFAAFSQLVATATAPDAAPQTVVPATGAGKSEPVTAAIPADDPESDDYMPSWARPRPAGGFRAELEAEEAAEDARSVNSRQDARLKLARSEFPAIAFVVRQETAEKSASADISSARLLDKTEFCQRTETIRHPEISERAGDLWIPLHNWVKRAMAGREDIEPVMQEINTIGFTKAPKPSSSAAVPIAKGRRTAVS